MRKRRAKFGRVQLCTAAGLLAIGSGCAQRPQASPTKPPQTLSSRAGPGLDDLIKAASGEQRRPVAAAIQAPVPPRVEPLLGQLIDEKDERAWLSLQELLPRLAGPQNVITPHEATADAKEAALRRYVEGRQKLLAGDAAGALEHLQAATESDPASGEPWRELGEAQRLLGRRSEAIRSFRAAVAAGLADPRPLEFLGREALERGDFEESARILARAMLSDLGKSDPALTRIIPVEISRALAQQGYILAATQAIRQALNDGTALTATTRYGSELGTIFRRQGDLWRDVGDGLCRLGRYDDALEAYIQSEDLPSLERSPVRPRIVFALMKLGRPSAAAAAVLEDIAGRQGRASDTDLTLLRHIADHGGDSKRIAGALGALRGEGALTPSIERDLSLAQASLLSADSARRALREHLSRFPTDIVAAVRLFDSLDSAHAAVHEGALIAKDDIAAKFVAEALLSCRHADIAQAAESLPRSAVLVRAYLIAKEGRPREGLALVGSSNSAAALAARVEMALDAGLPDQASASIESLRSTKSPEAVRLLARCLLLTQHFKDALAVMRPMVETPDPSPPARIDNLILAGDLAARLGKADDAERWLNEAVKLDPYDDRAYSLLMVLHSAGGAGPDGAKLSRVLRDMRQNCPESRTIRMVRAREAMRRSQWDLAERELRRLVDEDPGEAGPVELLATTWQDRLKNNPTAAADARAWLESKLRRRPQSALLLAAWTTLEITAGRETEAEAPLRDAIAAGGSPDVSRVLERLLRDVLSRPDEADVLARARLSNKGRTVADAIELADIAVRRRDFSPAIEGLHADLPHDADLAPEQALHIATLVGQSLQLLPEDKVGPVACQASALLTRCIPLLDRMPIAVHQRRLQALAACNSITTPDLIQAAALATEQYPQLQTAIYSIVVQSLFRSGRVALVPDFFAACPPSLKSDVQLIGAWVEAVILNGTAADGRSMIEALHKADSLAALFNRAEDIKDFRAEAAYILGVGFAARNKSADSEAMYEFALTLDPDHAWSCNNLGYSLADRGIELDRASELLERAYRAKPKETPIIDSLGWLRYKQGIILDVMDAETGLLKTRGALSLLQAAAASTQGIDDNTIQDHLGDALWLAGRRDDAMQAWKNAANLSIRTIEIHRANAQRADADAPAVPPTDTAELAECRALIESTTAKREAAAAGSPVKVAPQIADPNPQPITPPPQSLPQPDADR
jgi:tetratricopeptide (TPR) repeat protein